MGNIAAASSPTIDALQAARVGVDRQDADWALARLEAALFARDRPQAVGRYTLERRLGSGGAGVVWLAHDPRLDRRVAIKYLRTEIFGDATRPEGRRRLIREARALAHLAHPNVVEIYAVERCDCTEPGTGIGARELDERFDLVLVMEYVEGETLAHWLDARPRPLAEILSVFAAAGRGLAAVHDLGLVHRDFKPANVVVGVDGNGGRRVKVLDFGLASGTSRSLESAVAAEPSAAGFDVEEAPTVGDSTNAGGTPLFMAPEQHDGGSIDARTDQYAFCVSLWNAVFGAPPFFATHLVGLARAKRFELPRPPRNVRVPRALTRILLRGLAVAPEARWPSMRALLSALERARPRARVSAMTMGAAAALTLGWIAWPSVERCASADDRLAGVWDDDRRASLRVELAARTDDAGQVRAVADELSAWATTWADAWDSRCRVTLAERDPSLACLEHAHAQLVGVVEALHRADVGRIEDAQRAVATLPRVDRCVHGDPVVGPRLPDDPARAAAVAQLKTQVVLAAALSIAGDHEQAIVAGREALAAADPLDWPPLRAQAIATVGVIEMARGEYAAAELALREAYFVALEAGDDMIAHQSAGELVFLVGYRLGRHDEGLEWARHAEARLGAPGVGALDEMQLRNAMGAMFEDAGRFDEAAIEYERSLALAEAELGPDHVNVAVLHNNLGNLAERRGDYVLAESTHRRALDIRLRVLGEDDEMTAMSWNNLGIALHRQDRSAEAEPYLRRALEVRERKLGADHPLVARTHMNLAVALKGLDRLADAETHLRRCIAILEARMGAPHPDLANGWLNLANVLRRAHRPDEALAAVERARTIYETTLPPGHPHFARVEESAAGIRESAASAGADR